MGILNLLLLPHPSRSLCQTSLLPLPLPQPPRQHLASSRTPSRWVWAPTSLLQPPACSMHVTTMRPPSPVSKAFRASTAQLEVGAGSRWVGRAGGWEGTGPSPVFPLGWAPHLAWLCGGPRCEGPHTFRASGECTRCASRCSRVTSTSRRCG